MIYKLQMIGVAIGVTGTFGILVILIIDSVIHRYATRNQPYLTMYFKWNRRLGRAYLVCVAALVGSVLLLVLSLILGIPNV